MVAALVLVFGLLALGYGLARAGVFADDAADAFNKYVVYVSLPALVLLQVPKLAWASDVLLVVLMPWSLLLVSAGLTLWAARAFAWPRPVVGALLLCVPLGNTSFVGIPIVAALRGPEAVRYAVLYDQFGSFLALSTYGLVVLARYSGEAAPGLATLLKRVLTFPPFVALMLALIPFPHPPVLDGILQRIADTLAPVAMFAVGLRLRFRPPEQRAALFTGLSIKMLICPLLAWLAVRWIAADQLGAQVAVLEAGMPPMVSAGALAAMAGLAPELCAALVGWGVVFAFVSVPLIAATL